MAELLAADRAPGALAGTVSGLRSGEPGWNGAMDGFAVRMLVHVGR